MKYLPILILLCTTACALSQEPQRTFYEISPEHVITAPTAGSQQGAGVVRVVLPHAAMGLDSAHIQVQQTDGSFTWIKNAEWIEPPAKMLEPLLVRSLEASGRFSAVVGNRSDANATFDLETNLEKLTLVEGDATGAAHVEVALRFAMIKLPTNTLLSSQLVTASEPVETLRMAYIVPAFEKALGRCLEKATGGFTPRK